MCRLSPDSTVNAILSVRDQVGSRSFCGELVSCRSSDPSLATEYRSTLPLRFVSNAIREPSPDQVGSTSAPREKVISRWPVASGAIT